MTVPSLSSHPNCQPMVPTHSATGSIADSATASISVIDGWEAPQS